MFDSFGASGRAGVDSYEQTNRRHRRRSRRSRRRVHACRARQPRAALRSQRVSRRQGGRARAAAAFASTWGRRSSRCPRCCAASSRKPAARSTITSTLTRLDPQWRCFFEDGSTLDLTADAAAMTASSSGSPGGYGRGLRAFHADRGATSSHLRAVLLLEVRRRRARHARSRHDVQGVDARRPRGAAHGAERRGHDPPRACPTSASRRCSITSRSTSARRRTGRRPCCAASRTCRPRAASGTRAAARVRCRAALTRSRASSASSSQPARRSTASSRRTARRAASGSPTAARSRPTPSSRTWTPCARTTSCSARARARRSSGAAATSRRARASCCTSACASATTTCCTTTSCSRRIRNEEFDAIYREGRPAPDPTCYVAAPAATDASVAPPGGEALYVLVHTPYLRPGHDWQRMLAPYRERIIDKLKTSGGMPDLEERIVFEAALTPADIERRYRVLTRRDLRAREPRQVSRRVQARQPQPGPRGALFRRRLGTSRARRADGVDVGLDRRRRGRPRLAHACRRAGGERRAPQRGARVSGDPHAPLFAAPAARGSARYARCVRAPPLHGRARRARRLAAARHGADDSLRQPCSLVGPARVAR